jgi:hypothetical protein
MGKSIIFTLILFQIMSTKNTLKIFALTAIVLLFINAVIKKEKDPLHKKIYNTQVIEVKDGQNGKKALPDELEFKDGKLFSNVLKEKFEYNWLRYEINKDSTYIDSTETEIRYFEFECSYTDDKDQTMVMKCVIDEFDIDGEIKITKNDKLKKMYVFNGKEKYVKPAKKKEKTE